jgi:protein TonB
MMLVERPRLRARLLGPLAVALGLHALALGLAAAFGFTVPARVEEAFAALVIGLSERPEPLPELVAAAPLDALESSFPDDFPVLEEPPEPLPFDLAAFDLAALPSESIVEPASLVLDPPAEIAPGAEALGLLTPRVAVKSGTGGAAPAPEVVQGSGGGAGGDPTRSGTADEGTGAAPAVATVASAPRPAVVREPAPRAAPAPVYPRLSVRAGEEGSVLCRLHISERGEVTEVEVVESSGFERLDEAARATLLGWSFEPRRQDERAVASTLLHRVTFRLES